MQGSMDETFGAPAAVGSRFFHLDSGGGSSSMVEDLHSRLDFKPDKERGGDDLFMKVSRNSWKLSTLSTSGI